MGSTQNPNFSLRIAGTTRSGLQRVTHADGHSPAGGRRNSGLNDIFSRSLAKITVTTPKSTRDQDSAVANSSSRPASPQNHSLIDFDEILYQDSRVNEIQVSQEGTSPYLTLEESVRLLWEEFDAYRNHTDTALQSLRQEISTVTCSLQRVEKILENHHDENQRGLRMLLEAFESQNRRQVGPSDGNTVRQEEEETFPRARTPPTRTRAQFETPRVNQQQSEVLRPHHANSTYTLQANNSSRSCESTRYANIIKMARSWNLKYPAKGLSAQEFLTKVSRKKDALNWSDRDALNVLPELFEKEALDLYETEHENWKSWSDFKRAFILWFGCVRGDQEIQMELATRQQMQGESGVAYTAKMRKLFSQLSVPVATHAQIDRIIKGLYERTVMSMTRRSFETFDQLVFEINRAEELTAWYDSRQSSGCQTRQRVKTTAQKNSSAPALDAIAPTLLQAAVSNVSTVTAERQRAPQDSSPEASPSRSSPKPRRKRTQRQNRNPTPPGDTPKTKPAQSPEQMVSVPGGVLEEILTALKRYSPDRNWSGQNQQRSDRTGQGQHRSTWAREPRQLVCFRCRRPGHVVRECPEPSRLMCNLCGGEGHMHVYCSMRPKNDNSSRDNAPPSQE